MSPALAYHSRESVSGRVKSPSTFFPASGPDAQRAYAQGINCLPGRLALNTAYRYSDFSRTACRRRVADAALYEMERRFGAVATTALDAIVAAGFGFNPALVPESSTSWEVGVDQRLFDDRVLVGATYFDIDFDDLINYVFNPMTFSFDAMNIDRASSRGVEVTGEIELDDNTVL